MGGQAGRSAVGEVARVVDRGDQVDVRQRHQRLEGLAVLGREGALRLLGARQFLERGGVRGGLRLVRRGDAAGPLVDDDGEHRLVLAELFLQFHDLGRFGAGRQPGRRVVLLDVAELAGEGAEGGQ
ncbi:hypothetical protein LUX33_36735 [Actinomadura madurae]|nr:hypothetical protein [Actinomadura madurae]MCP9953439.1 hypothetical protein [Actinomadura madurae]MCP9970201.1 hypothetical protein [Actinomadura madurae]